MFSLGAAIFLVALAWASISFLQPSETYLSPPVRQYDPRIYAPHKYILMPGDTLRVPVTITNAGTMSDTFTIVSTTTKHWANVTKIPTSVNMSPGESLSLEIPFVIPRDVKENESASASVTVSSMNNPNMTDFVKSEVGVSLKDLDADGVPDEVDNCPTIANRDQTPCDKK